MPPKKKKATKGKTKAPEPAAFTDRDALKRCEHDLAMLQHENEVLRLELQSSKVNETNWRTQVRRPRPPTGASVVAVAVSRRYRGGRTL